MKHSIVLLALAGAVSLAQAEDTLKKIRTPAPSPSVCVSRPGCPYTIGDGKYVGYHIDVCEKIVSDVRKALGLSGITTKYQPVTSANRILTVNGTVDLECGSTTNNATRQRTWPLP